MRALVVVVLLAGCAANKRSQEDLMLEVRALQEGIRWRRYDDVAARLPVRNREEFLDEREEVDRDLYVDDYEITRVKVRKGKDEGALVQVRYTWHLDSVGVVHETTVEQTWEKQGKNWFLTEQKHRRGEPMPGVPAAESAKE